MGILNNNKTYPIIHWTIKMSKDIILFLFLKQFSKGFLSFSTGVKAAKIMIELIDMKVHIDLEKIKYLLINKIKIIMQLVVSRHFHNASV